MSSLRALLLPETLLLLMFLSSIRHLLFCPFPLFLTHLLVNFLLISSIPSAARPPPPFFVFSFYSRFINLSPFSFLINSSVLLFFLLLFLFRPFILCLIHPLVFSLFLFHQFLLLIRLLIFFPASHHISFIISLLFVNHFYFRFQLIWFYVIFFPF